MSDHKSHEIGFRKPQNVEVQQERNNEGQSATGDKNI
jgi:hypothetical protein